MFSRDIVMLYLQPVNVADLCIQRRVSSDVQ